MAEEILGTGENDTSTDVKDSGEEKATTALTDDKDGEKKEEKSSEKSGEEKTGDKADHKKDDTDDKTADGKTDDSKDGAPDEYEAFTVPDGQELDTETIAEATPLLKELGATQAQAQSLLDLQSKQIQKIAMAQKQAWTDQQSEWQKDAENDEEIGKGKYDESTALARKVIRTYGTPELMDALVMSGTGHHKEFIRVFARIAKDIGEDNLSFGKGNREAVKSHAETIFHKHQNPG